MISNFFVQEAFVLLLKAVCPEVKISNKSSVYCKLAVLPAHLCIGLCPTVRVLLGSKGRANASPLQIIGNCRMISLYLGLVNGEIRLTKTCNGLQSYLDRWIFLIN
jgi:hypothetical protein